MKASDIQSDKSRQTSGLRPAAKAGNDAKFGLTSASKASTGATASELRERVCAPSSRTSGNFANDAVLRSLHPSHARSGSTSGSRAGPATPHHSASHAQAFSATTAWLLKNTGLQTSQPSQTSRSSPSGWATAAPATRNKPLATAPTQAVPARSTQAIRQAPSLEVALTASAATATTTAPTHPAVGTKPSDNAKSALADALPSNRRNAGCSVIARDLAAGHLTPVDAVRIAGDFNHLETYAEVSRLAVGMLPAGGLLQRAVLWNLYLAYAGCGKRPQAIDVLDGLFAIDKVVLGQPLSRVLAHYDLGYMERVEATMEPGDKPPTCIGQMIDRAKANLLAWCDVRGVQRATSVQDGDVDYAALTQDLHGAQSPEGDTCDMAVDARADVSGEHLHLDRDPLATLMRHLDVTVEAERRGAMAEQDAMSEAASDAASDFEPEDADPLRTLLDRFGRG